MRNVLDCINAFIPLLSTEYELVLGRKGVSVTLRISFDKKDCFHLMGLKYLVDRPELSRDRGRVFDEIADGTITIEKFAISFFRFINYYFQYNKIETKRFIVIGHQSKIAPITWNIVQKTVFSMHLYDSALLYLD